MIQDILDKPSKTQIEILNVFNKVQYNTDNFPLIEELYTRVNQLIYLIEKLVVQEKLIPEKIIDLKKKVDECKLQLDLKNEKHVKFLELYDQCDLVF